MNTVVVRSIDRERVRNAVKAFAARLCEKHPEIQHIIWFGSWVNGSPTSSSDVDLCMIVSSCDKPAYERISDYLPRSFPAGFPAGIDLFVDTQDEFELLQFNSPHWH